MKKINIYICGLLLILSTFFVTHLETSQAQTKRELTQVFVVRHAEKVDKSETSDLTEKGEKRAETLASMLSASDITDVYSTNFKRTIETVNNYTEDNDLEITLYDTVDELVKLIQLKSLGEKSLVVGHSNNISEILEKLGIDSPPNVGSEYNNLFIVTFSPNQKALLTNLKYEIQD